MKKGFTLSEMLVTLSIVGVVSALTIPALKSAMPNEEMLKFKKAYYLTERLVSELVNDEVLYPDDSSSTTVLGNSVEVIYNGMKCSGSDKFCKLFAERMNLLSDDVNCDSTLAFKDKESPKGTVTSSDGIVWILPCGSNDFKTDDVPGIINVDVNGDKKPNCTYNDKTCKSPDRFKIIVTGSGKVKVDGVMEKEYLLRSSVSKNAKMVTKTTKK